MNRIIVFVGLLTGMLLVGWGCESQQPVSVPPPPAEPAKTAMAEADMAVEPKPAEPPQVQMTTAEPNKQEVIPPEPDSNKPETIEPASQMPAENNLATPPQSPKTNAAAEELFGKCTEFLSRYVDKEGYVDYRTLTRKRLELLEILNKMKTLDRKDYNSWSQEDKIAFWINAYNLELIKIILDNYPIESNRMLRLFWPPNSIRHIKGIWNEHKFIIMDEEFTLEEIEQRFFGGEFDEPRVFFAISYASVSGPPLRNKAYYGKKLSEQLDDQVKKFLAGTQGFKINQASQTVYLSSILKPTWYGEKFISKYGTNLKFKQQEPGVRAVLNFLTKYIPTPEITYLETGNYKVDFITYDWTLNERAGQ